MKAMKIGTFMVLAAAVFAFPAFAADDEAEDAEKEEVVEKAAEKKAAGTAKAEKAKSKPKNPFASTLKTLEKIDKDLEAAQEAGNSKKVEALTKQKSKVQDKLAKDLERRTASIEKKISGLEKKLEKEKDAKKKTAIQADIDKLEKEIGVLESLSRGEDASEE